MPCLVQWQSIHIETPQSSWKSETEAQVSGQGWGHLCVGGNERSEEVSVGGYAQTEEGRTGSLRANREELVMEEEGKCSLHGATEAEEGTPSVESPWKVGEGV